MAILPAMTQASVGIDSVIYVSRQDYAVAFRLESGNPVSHPLVISFGPSRSDWLPLQCLGQKTFQGSELWWFLIPRTVEIISSDCFSDCEHLTSVTFEANSVLRRIGTGAFSFCSALREIVVPRRVKFLGENCFSACSPRSAVGFEAGSSPRRIEAGTFAACSRLERIVVSRSVAFLDGGAFSNLQRIEIVLEGGIRIFVLWMTSSSHPTGQKWSGTSG
jgi:hypothetical protein